MNLTAVTCPPPLLVLLNDMSDFVDQDFLCFQGIRIPAVPMKIDYFSHSKALIFCKIGVLPMNIFTSLKSNEK